MERVFNKELEKLAMEIGASIFGVADVKEIKKDFFSLSENVLKDLDYAISIGVALSKAILEDIDNLPTKIYYHHYRQVNIAIDQIILRISNFIQANGYRALPIPASQIIDWHKQRAHLSHKKIGLLAGLGFIGRNNLLVNPKLGAQFRLGTILTNVPLDVNKKIDRDCGDCLKCIAVCPADAIKEKPQDFEFMNCYEKLREFRDKRIVDQYICGVCVKVCRNKQ